MAGLNINNIILSRLDIIVKILYIKGYIEGENFPFYKKLYEKHIKLYNGAQEEHKNNIEHFIQDFESLIDSFQKNGFNKNYPIPINKQGFLINGAHRLACCLYFDIKPEIQIEDNDVEIVWGFDWFKKNLFSDEALITLMEELNNYIDLDVITIWPPYAEKINHIIKEFTSRNIEIIGSLYLKLSKKNLIECVNDIYSYDSLILRNSIYEKAVDFISIDSNIRLLIVKNNPSIDKKNIKSQIRELVVNEKDSIYNTFHWGEEKNETEYMKKILLNRNNISHLKMRNRYIHNDLYKRLKELEQFLNESGIKKSDVCIAGSGSLGVYGIDKVSDVDIILSKVNDAGVVKRGVIDVLDYQYYKDISNENIIKNNAYHFYFRGFKFINLTILQKVKGLYGSRQKDIDQSIKIKEFLNDKSETPWDNLLFHLLFWKNKIKIKCILIGRKITIFLGIYTFVSYFWRRYILKNFK